jgi:hypothetical protein
LGEVDVLKLAKIGQLMNVRNVVMREVDLAKICEFGKEGMKDVYGRIL